MGLLNGYESDDDESDRNEGIVNGAKKVNSGRVQKPLAHKSSLAKLDLGKVLGIKQVAKLEAAENRIDVDQLRVAEKVRESIEDEGAQETETRPADESDSSKMVEFDMAKFYAENHKLISSGKLDHRKIVLQNSRATYYGVGNNNLSNVISFTEKNSDKIQRQIESDRRKLAAKGRRGDR
ncbi:hypothetical protein KL905_005163 [Ogataea polymorpha]|uniref:Uncharacterized protein n=1 Tax=Ogataea polymorpha TaxID=460523 RepID=A0A1B7SBF6_9ASCO|nr:uncharacterized protein OGAPODRAFT_95947 [Ogataea polymorpha]KAG7876874.1 hypothetical protein KL937_005173 [Ogataea polymorpha]KAG7897421.1 hypothetical protein KL935_005230 [Ogataea polymorpha]KAG7898453.1 hypothetical protein KL907_005213 [Ogataea polymorpha]KAG7905219.1 hypothetical protein KL906_005256 [Ogataea polymorpha]KAG7914879.1 hypothetical protein KL905_005163 [Ogataea polymorpha]